MNLKGRTQHVDKFHLRFFFENVHRGTQMKSLKQKFLFFVGGKMKSFIVVLQGSEGKKFFHEDFFMMFNKTKQN